MKNQKFFSTTNKFEVIVKMVKRKIIRKKSSPKKVSKWRAVPLKGSFMVTAILGLLISYYYVFSVSYDFGIASMLFFIIMFIASIVSMTRAPLVVK
jgi:hypothetical protein